MVTIRSYVHIQAEVKGDAIYFTSYNKRIGYADIKDKLLYHNLDTREMSFRSTTRLQADELNEMVKECQAVLNLPPIPWIRY